MFNERISSLINTSMIGIPAIHNNNHNHNHNYHLISAAMSFSLRMNNIKSRLINRNESSCLISISVSSLKGSNSYLEQPLVKLSLVRLLIRIRMDYFNSSINSTLI